MAKQIIVTQNDYGIELETQFVDDKKKPLDITDYDVRVKIIYDDKTIDTILAGHKDSVNGIAYIVLEKEHLINAGLHTSVWSVVDEDEHVTAQENVYYFVKDVEGSEDDTPTTDLPIISDDVLNKFNEIDNNLFELTEQVNVVKEQLDNLDKKENKYFQLAPLPSGGDDTETIQNLIGSNKTILLPFGATYKLNSININNISNLTIIGNNSRFLKNNGNGAMINISECSFVTIKNLEMDYSLTLTSPTNEDSCITVNNYSYIEINSCKFVNFKNVAINLKTAKDSFGNNGGTTSTPCLIEKCKFLDQANLSTNTYATSILLGEDSEYCKILYNELRNVWSAIRGYGANSLIDGNTIMDCRATFIPSNGLIYLHSDDGVNSGKHIISNNMINHNEKGATAIYCVGNLNREEKRFTIINNNILVHGLSNDTNGYGIGVNNADASLISGNYIKVKPNNKCNILVENSSNVIVTNNTLQNSVGINGTNSTFHENNNIFINTVKDVLCLDNSRIIEKTYVVRLRWNGEISSETNLKDITCEKNGTGTLILSHNFGHVRYVVNAIVDADTRFAIPVITRTENTIEVRCFDNDGALTDRSVMLTIHTS